MKTTIFSLFLLLTLNSVGQTSDALFDLNSKSLIVSYRGFNSFGFYLGGHFKTQVNEPMIYTTPLAIINRGGLNLTYKNKVSLMFGLLIKGSEYDGELILKINPLRCLLKKDDLPDLSVAVISGTKPSVALGISIPFRGIY